MTQRVDVCSPEEARAIIEALEYDPAAQPKMLRGSFTLACREANGREAWRVAQENLITDYGRRRLMVDALRNGLVRLFTSPSGEAPLIARSGLADDGAATSAQVTAALNATYDGNALTKSWFTTFSTPASTRRIGTVGLCKGYDTAFGVFGILAYALLNPVRTQTTTQTLELRYTIALTPVY